MRRPKIYANAEKRKLIAVVEHLVGLLGRPVCSADLESHFRAHPEDRPMLMQRLGQLLLKASLPLPAPIPYLSQIGIIRNRAYYAADASQTMREAFEVERRRRRATEAAGWRMADYVGLLIGSEHEGIARMAAAGFLMEFGGWAGISTKLDAHVSKVRPFAEPSFDPVPPVDLIRRGKAVSILRAAAAAFYEDEERARHIHSNKLLAPWSWPQSSLFPAGKSLFYSAAQVRLLAETRFGDDQIEAHARLACSRYVI